MYPLVVLNRGREVTLTRRHQWIFSKAIKSIDPGVVDGDLVHIADVNNTILATGHYHNSSLALRILDFKQAEINADFWMERFAAALTLRKALNLIGNQDTNAYRLIHGEGDELPGLIIDIYNQTAVIQAHSLGMLKQRHLIAKALMDSVPGIQAVYDKRLEHLQHLTPDDQGNSFLAGTSETTIRIQEHGISFLVDIAEGQKTGFFLDQRVNRKLVQEYASGKDVLNLFSYTGGFSLHALAGGAQHVTSVDSSAAAIALLDHNISESGISGLHQSVRADVMNYLNTSNVQSDVVICDPPAFAKSIQKRHNAVQAYKRLNVQAIRSVKPGGMLFTFSCSQVVDRQLFYDTIVAAAIEAGRPARVIFDLRQSPDHPVSIFHPEGSYLKGLALFIEA
jgi:23S rRNA (cytosine1962-C5)-methyltransferase